MNNVFADLNQRLMALKTAFIVGPQHGDQSINTLFSFLDLSFNHEANIVRYQGEGSRGRNNLDEITIAYFKKLQAVMDLMMDFQNNHLMNERVDKDLKRIANIIQYTKHTLINLHFRNEQLQNSTFLALDDGEAQKARLTLMQRMNILNHDLFNDSINPANWQKTLRTVLSWCLKEELRVEGKFLWEPKRVPGARLVLQDGEKVCHVCNRKESQHADATVQGNQRDPHVFIPKYEETENRMYETRAYVKRCSIYDYVCEKTSLWAEGAEAYDAATKNPKIMENVSDHITKNARLPECPRLEPNRHAFAFRNGLLLLWNGPKTLPQFYPYFCTCRGSTCDGDECGHGCVPDIVATKYFDCWFHDQDIYDQLNGEKMPCENCGRYWDEHDDSQCEFVGVPFRNMERCNRCNHCGKTKEEHDDENCPRFCPFRYKLDAYFHVKTQWADSVYYAQNIKGEIYKWVNIFLGRMWFTLNEHDRWQCMMFKKGVAGTGKSVMVKRCEKSYRDDQVGRLQSGDQPQFIMGNIYRGGKAMIVTCAECDENCQWRRAEFLQTIAGDSMFVVKKGGEGTSIPAWEAPTIMAGNALPFGKDVSDAVARRVIMVDFAKVVPPQEKDNKLPDRMDQEQGAFLFKTAGLYLNYAYKWGGCDIWMPGLMPAYFKEKQQEVRENSSVLNSFLMRDEVLVKHPEAYISKRDFVETLRTFASENGFNLRGIKLTNDDFFRMTFQQMNLTFRKVTKAYPPNQSNITKRITYVMGVGLKEYFEHLAVDDTQAENSQHNNVENLMALDLGDDALDIIESLLSGPVLDQFRKARLTEDDEYGGGY